MDWMSRFFTSAFVRTFMEYLPKVIVLFVSMWWHRSIDTAANIYHTQCEASCWFAREYHANVKPFDKVSTHVINILLRQALSDENDGKKRDMSEMKRLSDEQNADAYVKGGSDILRAAVNIAESNCHISDASIALFWTDLWTRGIAFPWKPFIAPTS